MGFCSQCGEIMAQSTCANCGNVGSVNPVTGEETAKPNTTPDRWVSGLHTMAGLEQGLDPIDKATGDAPPSWPLEPFLRGKSKCGACAKTITGEAMRLSDNRLVHSTCFMCCRCGIRLYDTYKASGTRIFCDGKCGPGELPELTAVHEQDLGNVLNEADWYYSDGDSSDGPVRFSQLRKLLSSGAIAKDSYVWGR